MPDEQIVNRLRDPSIDSQQRKQLLGRYFDSVADERPKWRAKGAYYHRQFERYMRFLIPPGASVLVIGSGDGELLNALRPGHGVGIDISPRMVAAAQKKFPDLTFLVGDLEGLHLEQDFDYVVLDNQIGYLEDIQPALERLHQVCRPDTRVIIVYFNDLWRPILRWAESVGLRMPGFEQHWLPLQDIANLLYLSGFEVIKKGYHILCPIYVPFVSTLCNRVLVNLPIFWQLSLNEFVIARPMPQARDAQEISCSVVVPCRNERGNIEGVVQRMPSMGRHTEIIFVEGWSRDGTFEECLRVKEVYPDRDIVVLKQDGKGKADAVRKGFAHAKGDVLMILDADLTVPPEDLPKFFQAIVSGKGELVIGSRLVYGMEARAMRFLNRLGNRFFSWAFSYLLEQRFRDTLCGTKVLWRRDYERIAVGRAYFGDFDPFGDFDLLFGAAKLNLKIVEIPIRYRERTYGETQISRFTHGALLLKMLVFALRRLKFV
jgi:SAM-dependent methyltransferase